MKERECVTCEFWQRDGVDGICRPSSPRPEIMEEGKTYTLVWPRTAPDEWCGDYSPEGKSSDDETEPGMEVYDA